MSRRSVVDANSSAAWATQCAVACGAALPVKWGTLDVTSAQVCVDEKQSTLWRPGVVNV
jgi:hypothetical protein